MGREAGAGRWDIFTEYKSLFAEITFIADAAARFILFFVFYHFYFPLSSFPGGEVNHTSLFLS